MVLAFFLPAVFVALFFVLPGILFSFAFFRGEPIGVIPKAMLGVIFGLFFVPIAGFLETFFLNLGYSFQIDLLNSLLLWAITLVALHLKGMLSPGIFTGYVSKVREDFSKMGAKELLYAYGPGAALSIIMAVAYYVRYATGAAFNFFEFDPIFYDHVSEILLKTGSIPSYTYEIYFPIGRSYHFYAIVHYLTVSWMHAATVIGGLTPTKEFIVSVSQLYTPLVAVFMCVLAYLLFKEWFSEVVGLIAAATMALIPQLVIKLAAGVSDEQPFGVFAAVFLFAAFGLYLRKRDLKFAWLTAYAVFLNILGSAQSLWPMTVMTAAIVLLSALDFRNREITRQEMLGQAIIFGGTLVAGIILDVFDGTSIFNIYPGYIFISLVGFLSYLAFYLYQEILLGKIGVDEEKQRKLVPVAFFLIGIVLVLVVPLLHQRVLGYISSTSQFANRFSPLEQTIQEEGSTTPDIFPSAFGSINPNIVLLLTFLALSAPSVINFFKKDRYYGLFALFLVLLVTLLSPLLQSFLLLIVNNFLNHDLSLTGLITTGNVLGYTLMALIIIFADTFINGTDNREVLFFTIVIFPVSYIGLQKLKYLLHLGVSISIAVPFMIGYGKYAVDYVTKLLAKHQTQLFVFRATSALVLLVGMFVAFSLASTVPSSMSELSQTRISDDWMQAYAWMRSTPSLSPANCTATYGYNCRVLSWWDYGHWTTFFGDKQSVLDPGNAYPDFDQEVAKSYVDGNVNDMKYTISYHNVTTIIADADLIGKWGALVYLSGSCKKDKLAPICFDNPPINGTAVGQSRYEVEHFYELLNPVGQCPASLTPTPLNAYKSSLTGAIYCLSDHNIFGLTNQGLAPNYNRAYLLVGRDSVDSGHLQMNTSYLFPYGNGVLLNANPDLSYAGFNNTAINAAFIRMYFFEDYPGTKLIYRSPNNQVKIFEVVKGGPLLP